ncbi:PEP-CTERM sorting domain-containing protein [Aquabacterium sp.]|uniref:PEP-CTERM sorting domain-containing protein n=1 Tax=Aquabacterium sp. TaxID=1872578 RepID=UPI0024879677|nr:PEP-CTERM sorting domain-containing protein [Aquabacterium sp.]MDI1260359.1 PEP-CTERM sorting domain-containing protein [Aquabacterium sp.]
MNQLTLSKLLPAALLMGSALVSTAHAVTKPVNFNVLNVAATLPTPFAAGDNLRLNTLVTDEVGPLNQSITFTVGAGIGSFTGEAAWEISTAVGTAPRLIGVNLDLFDSSNTLVASDAFAGVLGGFAHSTLAGAIGPGTYKLVATGTGVRDSSLDVTLSFAAAVPEPQAYLLMLAGLGVAVTVARRRP